MAEIPLRLIKVIGVVITGAVNFNTSEGCKGKDEKHGEVDWGYHRVEKQLLVDKTIFHPSQLPMDEAIAGNVEDYFGLCCLHCGLQFTKEVYDRSTYAYSGREDKKPETFKIGGYLYDTASGEPEVGDIFEATWLGQQNGKPVYAVKLPKGWLWPTNQRASNCPHNVETPKEHQCWTVTGEVPNITVRPSILMGEGVGQIHGFITNGKWADC